MSDWGARFRVAQWEFKRFVKPNQMLVSFVSCADGWRWLRCFEPSKRSTRAP